MSDSLQESTRWELVRRLFEEASGLSAAHRDACLAEASVDQDVVLEVRRLLEANDRAGTFLDRPALRDAGHVTMAGESSFWIGRRVGAYRIIREIGDGGMGRVFLAERADALFEKKVAIKVVRLTADAELLAQRFARERHILATLDHPNISRLLDAGTTGDGLPYVVMELVEGLPIDEFCDRHRLTLRERLALFRDVCMTVHAAHERGVIHRDLKPGNILVTADRCPKLLDFGIAKVLEHEAGDPVVTQTSARMLTPMTAAPEQVSGGRCTPATDVYSLGVLLYRLVTLEYPYRAPTTTAALERAIVASPTPKPSSATGAGGHDTPIAGLDTRAARALDAIALRALRKAPADRYASAAALAEDVQRHLDGHAPEAARWRAFDFRSRVTGAKRWAVAAVALVIFAAVAWAMLRDTQGGAGTAAAPPQTVAIRPFIEINGAAESKIGWGMADALLTRLGSLNSLRVRLSEDSAPPEGATRDAGSDPGADVVIEGTIQRSGTTMRVTARLVQAETNTAAWTTTAQGESSELFALQDRLSIDIARRLVPRFDVAALRARSTTGHERAYEAYVEGRYYLNLATSDSVRRALAHFERATAEDPAFAAAYAGVASTYAWLREVSPLTPPDQARRGRAAALEALRLEPSVGEAHAALGVFTLIDEWNWPEAERSFRRALELSPGDTMAAVWYAAGLTASQRFDEALEHLRRAEARDPFNRPVQSQLVRALYMARRFGDTSRECQRLAADDATFAMWPCGLARVLSGSVDEGIAELEALVRTSPRAINLAALGYAYGRAGRRGDATRVAAELARLTHEEGGVAYFSAEVSAGLGDRPATLALLERAQRVRYPAVVLRAQVDPKFDLLSADERARLVLPLPVR